MTDTSNEMVMTWKTTDGTKKQEKTHKTINIAEQEKKKNYKKIGTWNIRSLNGKEIELAEEFEKTAMEILIITETKKKGKGIMEIGDGHLLIYSGVEENQRASAGVGCIIHSKIKMNMQKWTAVSPRIIAIEINYNGRNLTIIGVYGHDEVEKAEKKEEFWDELSLAVEEAKGEIYLLGDFNARVGIGNTTNNEIIGKHGENVRNNNGNRLIDFCQTHNLIITNAFFEHKDIHKYTRVEPSRGERSIIDYIIVDKFNRKMVNDVCVKRGYEINSDHFLVEAKLKEFNNVQTAKRMKTTKRPPVNINIRSYKLRENEIARKFENETNKQMEKLIERTKMLTLEEIWEEFKNIILNTAKIVCGTHKINTDRKQTAWWSENLKKHIKIKKQMWKKFLSNKTQENYKLYKEQCKYVKTSVREAKQKTWKDFGEKLERDSKGNQKLFYKTLKNMRNKTEYDTVTVKSTDGTVLIEENQIMQRWQQYFEQLLNADSTYQQKEIEISNTKEEIDIEVVTRDEVDEAIKKLKNGKSPGHDKITAEMFKNMGILGKETLRQIYNKVWNEEKVPSDWTLGVILPIHKKGDRKECNNYRGITILSTAVKVFEQIIERKLRSITEASLSNSQSGFRKGRSTQDNIFTIKEIINKTLTHNKEAYFAFLDMEKAFDRVPRQEIWNTLKKRNVGDKMINVIKSLYDETNNYVIKNNMKSEIFKTKEGVRQGGSLSPLLFIIYMDEIIRETNQRIRPMYIGYRNLQPIEVTDCAFADDVVLVTDTVKKLQENVNIWNNVLIKKGMKLNKTKTKVMQVAKETKKIQIHVDDTELEQVETYQYLGIVIEANGDNHVEINNRIQKANNVYYAMNKGFINKKEISSETKMTVFKTIYRPILTYGCESWVLNQRQRSKIQAIEMKYLRKVRSVTRKDRIRNDIIRKNLQIQSMQEFIEQRQLSWWGHLQRMNNDIPVKKIWESRTQGKRNRGRPKETWNKIVEHILQRKGSTWERAKQLAQDRKKWSAFVYDKKT